MIKKYRFGLVPRIMLGTILLMCASTGVMVAGVSWMNRQSAEAQQEILRTMFSTLWQQTVDEWERGTSDLVSQALLDRDGIEAIKTGDRLALQGAFGTMYNYSARPNRLTDWLFLDDKGRVLVSLNQPTRTDTDLVAEFSGRTITRFRRSQTAFSSNSVLSYVSPVYLADGQIAGWVVLKSDTPALLKRYSSMVNSCVALTSPEGPVIRFRCEGHRLDNMEGPAISRGKAEEFDPTRYEPINIPTRCGSTLSILHDPPKTNPSSLHRMRTAGTTAAVLLFAMLLAWLLLLRIQLHPIRRLSEAMTQAKISGDLNAQVCVPGGTEISDMAEAFNAMTLRISGTVKDLELSESNANRALTALGNQKLAMDEHLIVSSTDIRGNIVHANDKFLKISGYSLDELLGQNHRVIRSEEHTGKFFREMWKTLARGKVWHGEIKNRAKNGRAYWVDATIVPIKDERGKAYQYQAIRTDITETKLAQERLREAAEHDRLTELPNRELFLVRLQEAISQAQRDSRYKFAVLFFDFDRFKVVNDSLGHDAGDALLKDIALRFQQVLRDSDTAARFGGDEFCVLLTDLKDYQQARSITDRLLKVFNKPHDLGGNKVTSTASIGLVTNATRYTRAQDMLRDADAAMYQAKDNGKARVVEFDQAMHLAAVDRLRIEADLRLAVERDEMKLVYQPIVSLRTSELDGFEALVRWHHPERGVVSPADFIPIAEDSGLIVPLGQWTVREACSQLKAWNTKIRADKPIRINVNLSMRQINHPGAVEMIRREIAESGIDPHWLKLEITESVIAGERSDVLALLKSIKRLGVQLAMDDFGTGHSSLSNLHRLPIDVLKIDQSFVKSMSANRELAAVMQTIITLAQHLGMSTVAEGIETHEQLAMLQALDCEFGQGYYFKKPMYVQQATDYLMGLDESAATSA
jgi:diguanylate cyclase (GGDEF)-like protein/PAS domain S-box-containing protein